MFIINRDVLEYITHNALFTDIEKSIPHFRDILQKNLSYSIHYEGHVLPDMSTDVMGPDGEHFYHVYFSKKLVEDVRNLVNDYPLKMAPIDTDVAMTYKEYDDMPIEVIGTPEDYDKEKEYYIVLQLPNLYFLREELGLNLGNFENAYGDCVNEFNRNPALNTQIGGYPFYIQCDMDPHFIMYFYGEDGDIYLHNVDGSLVGEMQC